MAASEVKLVVGGSEFSDWLSFEVESDILQPADAFSFTAPNLRGALAGKISAFDTVKVVVDGTVVMRGFVDDVSYSNGVVNITGRDNFGHLVDCGAPPKTYKQTKLDTLAQTLAGTWVSTWQVDPLVTLSVHKSFKVEPGEAIMDALLRLARKERVLIWLDPQGYGRIGRPDYSSAPKHSISFYPLTSPMSQQNNVEEQEVVETGRERFSTITVLGSSGNSITRYGKSALQKQTDTDATVGTTRSLVVTDGDVRSIQAAKQKATDEVERRAFDGLTLRYTCKGFYGDPPTGDKALFEPDQRVAVTDKYADLDGVYYMSARSFRQDLGGGQTTRIELHPGGWME